MDGDDVGMIEPGGGLGFDQESPFPLGIGDLFRRQSFQGDDTLQPGVARLIDLAHSSHAEKGEDLVRTDTYTGGKSHRLRPILT